MSGRKAKPFIDKKSSEHFLVVHRSLQDPKSYDDTASKHVLVSSKEAPSAPIYRRGASSVIDGVGRDGMDDGRSAVTEDVRGRRARGVNDSRSEGGFSHRSSKSKGGWKNKQFDDKKSVSGVSVATKRVSGKHIQEYSELDEMGFPIDGYDYSKHFSALGGGIFFSSTGQVVPNSVDLTHEAAAKVDLPDDVLPSKGPELDRMLEAIVLKEDSLPADIRKALQELDDDALSAIGEDDEEENEGAVESKESDNVKVFSGRYEELDDDFVLQALGEADIPEWPEGTVAPSSGNAHGQSEYKAPDDFDFDAHIAKLMAKAEGKWTDTADDFDKDEDEEEDDDDDAYEEGAHAHAHESGDRIDDSLLAAVLKQYDDDEIGELDDDDPRLRSGLAQWQAATRGNKGKTHGDDEDDEGDEGDDDWEEDDGEDEEDDGFDGEGDIEDDFEQPLAPQQALDRIINEYIAKQESEREDLELLAGIPRNKKPKKLGTAIEPRIKAEDIDAEISASASHEGTSVRQNQAEGADVEASKSSAAFSVRIGGVTDQSDDAERAPRYYFEVESDESDGEAFNEKYLPDFWRGEKPEKKWDVETIVSTFTNTENHPQRLGGAVSITSSRTGFGTKMLPSGGASTSGMAVGYGPKLIVLSKKTGLPLGRTKVERPTDTLEGAEQQPAAEEDGAGAIDEGDEESSGSYDREVITTRDKNETAEEKRARKQAVKEDRRGRRQVKKVLKQAFKNERVQQTVRTVAKDSLAHGMVIH